MLSIQHCDPELTVRTPAQGALPRKADRHCPTACLPETAHPLRHKPANLITHEEKKVLKVLLNFVLTSRASWLTQLVVRSTCFGFTEAMALSLAPVRRVKAIRARLRCSISVLRRHRMKDVFDLFQGRCPVFPLGGRNLVGQVEYSASEY